MNFYQPYDGSNAHLLPDSAAECAAYLRKFNAWRRGSDDDFLENPYPRELGLHIDFAVDVLDAMAGHDHLMVIAATRYCLGRMSYIVSDCADWLIKIWPRLDKSTKTIIKRDIEDEFRRDNKAREDGGTYRPLGMDCDRKQWERVRALWRDCHGQPEKQPETSAPAIVFFPAGSLGEEVERPCCGTFYRTPHRSTCPKYRGKK